MFVDCESVNAGKYCFNQPRMIALALDMNWHDRHCVENTFMEYDATKYFL